MAASATSYRDTTTANWRRLGFLLGTLSFVAGAPAFAAPPAPINIQFVSPPLPAAAFLPNQSNTSLSFDTIRASGDGFNLKGGGFDFMGRHAFDGGIAWDFQFGFDVAKGSMTLGDYGGMNCDLIAWYLQSDVEYQFFNSRLLSVAGYAGVVLPMSTLSPYPTEKYTDPEGNTYGISPTYLFNFMFGIPFGIKGALNLGRYMQLASSVGLIDYLGGTTSSSYNSPGYYTPSSQLWHMVPFMSTSVGAEVTVLPWGLSVGGLYLNSPASSGNVSSTRIPNVQVKSTKMYVAWRFGPSGLPK